MLRNPIIGQYVEALTDPFRIFRTLGEVVPERDIIGKTKIPSDFPDISKDNLEK